MSDVRIELVVTSGTFSLDGGTWNVDNNVWLLGDDSEVLVVDAAHDADAILGAVGQRRLVTIACTHAHDDHINKVFEVAERSDALVRLHPDDHPLWRMTFDDRLPDAELTDGQVIGVGGVEVQILHTPGHSPGSVCLYVPDLSTVFTGDTLFNGGPGATGRSFSDYPTIVASIREKLLTLPGETTVLTGHGDSTTVASEAPSLDEWLARAT